MMGAPDRQTASDRRLTARQNSLAVYLMRQLVRQLSQRWLETNFTSHSLTSLLTCCWCCHCVAMATTGHQPIKLTPASDEANCIFGRPLCLSLCLCLGVEMCTEQNRFYLPNEVVFSANSQLVSQVFIFSCKSQTLCSGKKNYSCLTLRNINRFERKFHSMAMAKYCWICNSEINLSFD